MTPDDLTAARKDFGAFVSIVSPLIPPTAVRQFAVNGQGLLSDVGMGGEGAKAVGALPAKCGCCDRGDEYNGFASGPLLFVCPKHCGCHD